MNAEDLSLPRGHYLPYQKPKTNPWKLSKKRLDHMSPEQLLQDVAVLIAATAKKSTGRVHVIRQGNEIKVISSSTRTSPVKPIASYDAVKAREGLTVKEWSILIRRLANTMKEIEKCREQSKP